MTSFVEQGGASPPCRTSAARFCATLARIYVPAWIRPVKMLTLNAVGKVNRTVLRDLALTDAR